MALSPVTNPARLNDNANYPGLTESLSAAGIHVEQQWPGGVWMTNDPVACQAFIDAYDPLPYARKQKRQAIKAEALVRVNILYPAIKDADDLDLEFDRWGSIKATSKAATPEYQKLLDIRAARITAVQAVNAATTVAEINAVVAIWP